MLNILLPSLPYQRIIDPMWEQEMVVAQQLGYSVCLYDSDREKLYQQPDSQYLSLYRGWMLLEAEYQQLAQLTPLLISPEMYLASHRADGWYEAIAEFTMPSKLRAAGAAADVIDDFLQQDGRCFVKGLSKSFGAASIISTLPEFEALLQQYHIAPSELLLIRKFVELSPQPEQRFFAVRDAVFGANGALFPVELKPALAVLQSRWLYTIDVAFQITGEPIIVEIGDGQVSDTKEWGVTDLYERVIHQLAKAAMS